MSVHPQPSVLPRRGIRVGDLDWPVVIGIAGMHLGALAAPFFFSWSGLIACGVLIWLTGAIGITLGYHRLLTHRSFRTPRWFEYLLTVIGTTAWQGGPVTWVGTHRIHHKHSDQPDDPHSPRHGFTWAHVLWCLHREPQGRRPADAARDLTRDPFMRLIDRFFWVAQFLLAGLLAAGGWAAGAIGLDGSALSWLVWAVCVRTVFVYHATWLVNSASHTWGYRNYDTSDGSKNLWWVGLLAFGEGWHNNHHAHQRSAAHGLRWFELDLTYWTIRLLRLVGLARQVVLPPPHQRPQSSHARAARRLADSRNAAGGGSAGPPGQLGGDKAAARGQVEGLAAAGCGQAVEHFE